MDIQAIRTELAALAPTGWEPYDRIPGAATLPALVVSMPDAVDVGASHGMARITIPVVLVIAGRYTAEAESKLMTAAVDTAAVYRGISGTAFRSCRVTSISQFLHVTVDTTEALSATVNLELLATRT